MSFVVCTVSAAPLRKEPSHRSEMTSQLLFGEMALLLGEQGEWLHLRCAYDGYEGWVTYHLVTFINKEWAKTPSNFVTTGLVNTLQFKSELFQIPMGCSLTGFNQARGNLWEAQSAYEGPYRNTKETVTKQLLRNTIRPWMNAPYLWGGKTFMGVDCSGFVQTVFKILGVPLLRDAYQQAEQGTGVDFEYAREGDVAFFKSEAEKIVHVGIILEGATLIHAAGKVRVDALTTEGIFIRESSKQTHQLHSIKRVIDFTDYV